MFLRAIVLQTCSSTECINSPTCRVKSPTSLFQWFLVLQTVGPTQQYDYRYGGQDQRIVSPTICRTINTLVETSVLLVYFMQDYRYGGQRLLRKRLTVIGGKKFQKTCLIQAQKFHLVVKVLVFPAIFETIAGALRQEHFLDLYVIVFVTNGQITTLIYNEVPII